MKAHYEKVIPVRHLRIIGSNLPANFALLLGLVLTVLVSAVSSRAQALRPAELSLPTSLVKVTTRNEGSPVRLFVVIGETHVNLKVQQNVADLLSYLGAAYGMNLVCTEGTD